MRSFALALVASCALVGCSRTTGTSTAATPRPAGPPPDPTSVRFAAGPARFRLEASTNTVQEVMGNSQEIAFTQSLLLSTALAETGTELALGITVDSLSVQGTVPGLDPATLSSARGQVINARFTPLGVRLGVTMPDSTNPVMMQLGRTFRDFLPRLPSAPIAAGVSWVDTTTDTQSLPGGAGQTSTRSVRQYTVVGWEVRDSVRALHISVTGNYEVNGTGEAQGQPLEISGTGQATGDRWVSRTGQYLGGTSRDSTNLTVNVLNMGMSIPIRQVQTMTVTRLPGTDHPTPALSPHHRRL
jgi:hypothetical protein